MADFWGHSLLRGGWGAWGRSGLRSLLWEPWIRWSPASATHYPGDRRSLPLARGPGFPLSPQAPFIGAGPACQLEPQTPDVRLENVRGYFSPPAGWLTPT